MNKGYLTFTDDNTGITMLKDEPEDLTHLAPTAGDSCIPLEDNPEFGLMGDLLDEFILPEDNYCPLLSDACSDSNSKQMSPSCHDDSFYTYRDDRSLSPDHSPGQCSLPSLSSMEDSPPMVEDSMNSLWGLDLVDSSSEELCVRAPYIPMPHDDLPLLTAGDLMWGAGGLHKPAPLNSQDPLLSSHSKTMSWSKCNSNSQNNHQTTSSHHQHQSSQQHRGAGHNNNSRSNGGLNSSLAKLLKSEPNSNSTSNNYEDAGGGGCNTQQQQQQTKYNKYSSKKGSGGGSLQSNTSLSPTTVLDKKSPASNKRCATPPEWDHRGYWKRSRTPSTTARSIDAQAQAARHNSVLMNLLVSGCDVSAGYVCLTRNRLTTAAVSSKYY
uniref:Uncharacterized protein n=1 Tax=Cacopsylla melanoneura TaxID=428564 RepID=A0A8D8UFQ1_9HEMI